MRKIKKGVVLYLLFSTTLVSCSYYRYHKSLELEEQQQTENPAPDHAGHAIAAAPDFKHIRPIKARKRAFFAYLVPGIWFENSRTFRERQWLIDSQEPIETQNLSVKQTKRLAQLAKRYKEDIPENGVDADWLQRMLIKVDEIPVALVLTQAANESAWGTSRFAREANNYFGQWCYRQGCGVVPLLRGEGMTHEVAKFQSVQTSIHRYFININSNSAYLKLRAIRHQLRKTNQPIETTTSAMKLTEGLDKYSERGMDYVNSLKAMMKHNRQYWTELGVK